MESAIANGDCVGRKKRAKEIQRAYKALERLVQNKYIPKWFKNQDYNIEVEKTIDLHKFCIEFMASRGWWN